MTDQQPAEEKKEIKFTTFAIYAEDAEKIRKLAINLSLHEGKVVSIAKSIHMLLNWYEKNGGSLYEERNV